MVESPTSDWVLEAQTTEYRPVRRAPRRPSTASLSRFRRALVVEPDADLCRLYAAMLIREGVHDVQIARDGAEAHALGMAYQPDLVVTEIGLPYVDGLAVLSLLRAAPGGQQLTAVVISGCADARLEHRASELGVALVLKKPVSFRSLPEVLRSALG